MKFLADENISRSVVTALIDAGFDILWVKHISPGASDGDVIRIARTDGRTIITADKDFGELVVRRQTPVGVILLRIQEIPPAEQAAFVSNLVRSRDDWARYLSVVDSNRVRRIALKFD